MKIELNVDGIVCIRDESGAPLYSAGVSDFEKDAGAQLPALPEGMVAFQYDTEAEILVYFDAKQNAHPIEGRHDDTFLCDTCVAVDNLVAANEKRLGVGKE